MASQYNAAPVGDTGSLLNDYFSEHEFAAELGVTLRTYRNWRALGEGPTITRIGKRVFIARSDARAWLKGQRVEVE